MHGVGALISRKVQVMYRALIEGSWDCQDGLLKYRAEGEEDGTCIG